jgi:hypothetical protein
MSACNPGLSVFQFSELLLQMFVWVPRTGNLPTAKPLPTQENAEKMTRVCAPRGTQSRDFKVRDLDTVQSTHNVLSL